MVRSKTYIIPLEPIPWKRAGMKGKHFYDRQTHEKLATGLYLQKDHGEEPFFTGPLKIEIIFHMHIPDGQKKKNLEGSWHFKRPDIDNLAKFILDAATGILWADDAIVCCMEKKKIYSNETKTVFIISELK